MRKKSRQQMTGYIVMAAVAALAFALFAEPTMAQCVMCRASLTNNSAFVRNLNIGVLVLLVPPVSMFVTIFVLAIRHRRPG
jgi:hypothetical protein